MIDNNLAFFNNNGLEIYIDRETGESFCSISGYARMVGLTKQAISKRIAQYEGVNLEDVKSAETNSESTSEGVNLEDVKSAETNSESTSSPVRYILAKIPTTRGIQTARILTEDFIVANLPKDKPEAAIEVFRLGVRMFLHKVAGFDFNKEKARKIDSETPSKDELQSLQERVKKFKSINSVLREAKTSGNFDLAKEMFPEYSHLIFSEEVEAKKPVCERNERDSSIQRLIALSKRKGALTARDVIRGLSWARRYKSSQIRTIFRRLSQRGIGKTLNKGKKLMWVYEDVAGKVSRIIG